MTPSGRRVVVALVLMAAAAVFASSENGRGGRGQDDRVAAPPPVAPTVPTTAATTTSSTTTTTLPPTYPLTGRAAPDGAATRRAVVTLKIDNAAAARPQTGLEHADVVYEELTEGITRLVALFHSTDAEVAGPVRSVRPADADLVTPFGGVLAFSGGSPAAVAVAASSPLTLVTEGDTQAMYRRPGRPAPYNLYTSTAVLRSRGPGDGPGPPPLAPFLAPGAPFAPAGSEPVGSISLVPAPFITAAYTWNGDDGTWRRTTDGAPHRLEGEIQVAPTNVVVQFLPYLTFEADAAVQYPQVVGSGDVWVFSAGTVVRGKWSKPSAGEPTTYTHDDGRSIALTPGQTWIHLLSPEAPVTLG